MLSVLYLMFGTRWYDYKISGLDILILTSNGCLGSPRCKGQGLINSMNLRLG